MVEGITRRAFLVGGATFFAAFSTGFAFRSKNWRKLFGPGRRRILSGQWWARQIQPGDRGELISSLIGGTNRDWISAVVPGTVITTLVAAGKIEDPYFGTNYLSTVDVHQDPDLYTYWFRHDFTHLPSPIPWARHWLRFRGINYTATVWLNGIRLTSVPLTGMFLRHEIDVTDYLKPGTKNRLVLLVEPPRPPGNPQPKTPEPPTFEPGMASSCQGEDRLIGRSVTAQFSGGWDFVQPQRDRNVGIWDKVEILETGPVRFATRLVEPGFDNTVSYGGVPRITTKIEWNDNTAVAAHVSAFMLLQNSTSRARPVRIRMTVGDQIGTTEVQLPGNDSVEVNLQLTLNNPELWWPNGHGGQRLYDVAVEVIDLTFIRRVSDRFECKLGIREIRSFVDEAEIDPENIRENGRVFEVNKKRIFIRGGCWTFPDARLRHDAQNYDDQVRLHATMNLNLIRLWGGGLTERTEFYEACDKHGILVWQEFWITADCNSNGENPRDPELFMLSALDAISLIRNHSSLALWVGGNEGPPPGRLNERLRRAIATNDPDREYVPYSTDPRGGFGLYSGAFTDGPYRIVEPQRFFDTSYTPHLRESTGTPVAYNPEYGSVGMPVSDTVRMIMAPEDYNEIPDITERTWPSLNEAWISHTYIPFFTQIRGVPPAEDQINLYGKPTSLDEFCDQAQAAQYIQYKALLEGRNAHMWTWYTGGNIWRSAPGWWSLRGGLYDAFLETTGGHAGAAVARSRRSCSIEPRRRIGSGHQQFEQRARWPSDPGPCLRFDGANPRGSQQTYKGDRFDSAELDADSWVAASTARAPRGTHPASGAFSKRRDRRPQSGLVRQLHSARPLPSPPPSTAS